MKIQRLVTGIDRSDNQQRVVRNIYWAVVGKCFSIVSELLVGILIARTLGPESFGLMNYVISYVMLFSVFSKFGLDGIETREMAKAPEDKEKILGTSLVLRLGLAFITLGLVCVSLLAFESDTYTFWMIMVYSTSLVFSSVRTIRNYFTSIILNEYVVKSEIFRTVFGAAVKLAIITVYPSLSLLIVASAFDFFLVGSGYVVAYRKTTGPILGAWTFDPALAKRLLIHSAPLALSGAAIVFHQKINAVMLRNMLDNAAVGQFAVAVKLTELSFFLPEVFAQSVSPLLVKAHRDHRDMYARKKQEFMDIMVWAGILLAVIVSLLASPMIRLVYGEAYALAIPVLQVMAWKTVFTVMFSASGQLIIIENLQKYAIIRNLMAAAVTVVLNLLLIPVWGVVGTSVSMVLSMAVAGCLSHLLIPAYRPLFFMEMKGVFMGWRTPIRRIRDHIR